MEDEDCRLNVDCVKDDDEMTSVLENIKPEDTADETVTAGVEEGSPEVENVLLVACAPKLELELPEYEIPEVDPKDKP